MNNTTTEDGDHNDSFQFPALEAAEPARTSFRESTATSTRPESFRLGGMEAPQSFRIANSDLDPALDEVSSSDEDDDDTANDSTFSKKDKRQSQKTELDKTLATVETKAVRFLRRMIWLGLAVTAVIICSVVYWWVRRLETKSFEDNFYDLADQFGKLQFGRGLTDDTHVSCLTYVTHMPNSPSLQWLASTPT